MVDELKICLDIIEIIEAGRDGSNTVENRNPSSAFLIAGVLIAFILALAGATVLYQQPQNRIAETRSMAVTQMQPAQLVATMSDTADETNARGVANRLLAESLHRQAAQVTQATRQVQAPAPTTSDVDSANAELTSPPTPPTASEAANVEQQLTGSMQSALQQPNADTSVKLNETPGGPTVEAPKVEALSQPTLGVDQARRLRARAQSMIQQGDISSARLILDRLAHFGDARAVFSLAETFDPRMLAQWKVRGITPEPARAKEFYSQAAKAGIVEARDRLAELGN
jgi:hypothetical protein